jgi:hypothetical protein
MREDNGREDNGNRWIQMYFPSPHYWDKIAQFTAV